MALSEKKSIKVYSDEEEEISVIEYRSQLFEENNIDKTSRLSY